MDKDNSDQYKNGSSVYFNSFSNIHNAFTQMLPSSARFDLKLYNAFAEAYLVYPNTVSEYGKSWSNIYELKSFKVEFVRLLTRSLEKKVSSILFQMLLPIIQN